MTLQKLNEKITLASQLSADDVKSLHALGFTAILNNRPDGEEEDQPISDEISAAAKQAGLNYAQIPITHDGISDEAVKKAREFYEKNQKIVCFCRSGTRSAMLWALSSRGDLTRDEILNTAKNAGYDLDFLREIL